MYARPYLYIVLGVLAVGILVQQAALVTLGVLGGLTLGIAWGWQRACLAAVTYTRRFAEDHVLWGETVALDVSLTNFKLLPLSWLETDELFPRQLDFVGHQPELTTRPQEVILGHTTAMRWFERIHWHYQVQCNARGLYRFGPVTLRSGDMFGLFTHEEEQPVPAHLYVYPQIMT